MLREDLNLAEIAKSLGWRVEFHRDDKQFERTELKGPRFPNFSLQFKKGDKVMWNAITHWVCAELNDRGQYVNHRTEKTLLPLLNKESEVKERLKPYLYKGYKVHHYVLGEERFIACEWDGQNVLRDVTKEGIEKKIDNAS